MNSDSPMVWGLARAWDLLLPGWVSRRRGSSASWQATCEVPFRETRRGRGPAPEGPSCFVRSERVKRGVDLALLVLSLPLVIPVALLVATAIKLVSPGPILFVQERVGRGGRAFRCLKFRTMEVNAPQTIHADHLSSLVATGCPLRKMDANDRRLIPLGRWLRTSGLDEIPQLWNVFRREMSWVGPRPCAHYEYALFEEGDRDRFQVLPGLTGLWQVSGKNDTTFREMVRMDSHYARNGSLCMDIRILARTPGVVLSQVASLAREWAASKTPAPALTGSSDGLTETAKTLPER